MESGWVHGRVRGRARTTVNVALVVAAVTVGGVLACSAKHDAPPGELLLAVDSNLKVPDDIDEIGVAVESTDGSIVTTDQLYGMAPVGAAKFPATLAVVRGTSGPIDIKVAGYKNGQAFALREVVTTIPDDRTAILRMDLNWLDNHTATGSGAAGSEVRSLTGTCAMGTTSVAGTCTSFQLDSATLTTFATGAIVASDDASACINVTDCILGGGTAGGSITVPATSLTGGIAADGTPQCTVVPPGVDGAFNIGLVLAPGGDGWCNSASCVIPLEMDATEGWQLGMDGTVHLPASVCTNAKVASLVFTPVSEGCPQYADEHPACQNYGKDGGTVAPGSEAGARMDATVADSATGDAASGDAGDAQSDGSSVTVVSDSYGIDGSSFLGFASNPSETTNAFLMRPGDGGIEYLAFYQSAPGGTLVRIGPLFPNPVDPSVTSIDMAATDGVFAFASGTAVQAFVAPTVFTQSEITDAGYFGGSLTTPASLLYLPMDGGARLTFGGVTSAARGSGGFLVWETGGTFQYETVTPGPVQALAYDPVSGRYAIAETSTTVGSVDAPNVITLAALSDTTPAANAPPATKRADVTKAVAFPATDTLVWWIPDASAGPAHLLAAPATTAAGPGTAVTQVTTGLFPGPSSMVGGGGKLFWISGQNQHIYEMPFAAGAPTGPAVDLVSTLESSGLVTQIGMTATHLVYTDGALYYRYPLENLP